MKFLSSGDISAIYIVYLAQMILGVTLSCQGSGLHHGVVPLALLPHSLVSRRGSIRMGSFGNGRDGIVSK